MARCLPWLWLLLVLFVGPAFAAVDSGIEVTRTTGDGLPADPGKVLTVGFRVSADDQGPRELVEALELPEGWLAVTPPTHFPMVSGGSRLRLLAFQVGSRTRVGSYEVRYRVTDTRDPGATSFDTVQVLVRELPSLRVEIDDPPAYVIAGDAVELEVRVINAGNAPLHAHVRATPETGLRAELDRTELRLEPMQSAPLRLRVQTNPDEERSTQRIVRLLAQAGSAQAEGLVVLPITRRAALDDRWRRLPLTLSLIGTTDGERWALQPELRGGGALDATGAWTTDLLLRGPDVEGVGAFSQRDEYRATVTGPDLVARLGDQSYALSALTSPNSHGRGAGLAVSPGALRAGAFIVQERFVDDPETEVGASAGAEIEGVGSTQLNLLSRLGEPEASILSLSGTLEPHATTELEAELARELAAGGDQPWAGRFQGTTRLDSGLTMMARETLASSGYDGYERDVHRSQGTVVLPLSERLSARADLLREARNLALDPAPGAAPLHHRAEAGLSWTPAPAWSIDGALAGASQVDRLLGDPWQELAARLQLSRGVRVLYASVQGAAGLHAASTEPRAGGQVGSYLVLSPIPPLSLRGWARYGSAGDEAPTSLFAVDSSVGAALAWQPGAATLFELEARHELPRLQDPGQASADQVDARAQLGLRHGIVLATRWSLRLAAETETSGLLSVSVPVGVPVGRNGAAGGVHGRVFDIDAPGAPGLEGVVVRVGGIVAVTGRDGRFTIGRLAPGSALLELDRNSLGTGRVGTQDLPLPIEIRGGEYSAVEIAMTRGASLRGRVLQAGTAARPSTASATVLGEGGLGSRQPVAGLTIILVKDAPGGGRRVTGRTDREGRFSFDRLPPGSWTLLIPRDELPTGFELADAGRPIELASGQVGETELLLKPIVRSIRRSGGGSLSLPGGQSGTDASFLQRRRVLVESPTALSSAALSPAALSPAAAAPIPAPTAAPAVHRPRRTPAVQPAVEAWARASYQAQATITEDAVFLGGRFALDLRTAAGAPACTVAGDWFDDGGELPLVDCPGCRWVANLQVGDVLLSGPRCEELDAQALSFAQAAFGWAPVFGSARRVLLRWNGRDWIPVAREVDPQVLALRFAAELPAGG